MAKPSRPVFQDVTTDQRATATPGGIDRGRRDARGALRIWLAVLFVMVVAIIAVGGATRLTDSGLSITEWAPVTGAIPPMNAADWQSEFDAYRASPQYELMNEGMSLSQFQSIYWWEWGHRQLGRTIGLVWFLGFAFFAATRRVPAGWTSRLLTIGVLVGLQGAIGWWMVSSGLEAGQVTVASYRLATHLGLAFGILGLIAWYILRLGRREAELLQARRAGERRLFGGATGLMHLMMLQILLGALVAGIDAGRAFPTWPSMNGDFFPANAFYVPDGGATWRAFFENPGLVQFIHRMAGYLLAALAVVVVLRARRSPHPATRAAGWMMLAMVALQIVLGIVTALTAAHLHVALSHQFGAVLLWVLILRLRFLARYPYGTSIRGTR
ncbi:heme A synthase [Pseudoroseicyclus aestuarii]|uniref:Heme A synthase n=1 Tax=Pseudoroseicyclus aestuarii TaxID=1795041 RepID=A0A318T263_9RHOB|nr:heme A synthase [Pseudoroseicyclus aestuarii]PYE86077.1 cytochrome c oxidase assembly protein subunit 15 [Pseudoroseicyclus aestuarii]